MLECVLCADKWPKQLSIGWEWRVALLRLENYKLDWFSRYFTGHFGIFYAQCKNRGNKNISLHLSLNDMWRLGRPRQVMLVLLCIEVLEGGSWQMNLVYQCQSPNDQDSCHRQCLSNDQSWQLATNLIHQHWSSAATDHHQRHNLLVWGVRTTRINQPIDSHQENYSEKDVELSDIEIFFCLRGNF